MLFTNVTDVTSGSPCRILPDHAVYVSGDHMFDVRPRARELSRKVWRQYEENLMT